MDNTLNESINDDINTLLYISSYGVQDKIKE
jgi:hypothetical protein